MKKVLLTAMAIVTLASASAFGMYGNADSWIDFLVHGNQFRARMNQLGFTLGNGTIKGTFGFKSDTSSWMANILKAQTGDNASKNVILGSTVSLGLGYTSDAFGIGVGYNYTYISQNRGIHTPVLTVNALNDNLRIAVPIQIAVGDEAGQKDYMGIRTDIQVRYYTGIDVFNAVRFYLNYGQQSYNDVTAAKTEHAASSLGLQLRLYFLNTYINNVNVNPYLKLVYSTSLTGNNNNVNSWDGNAPVKNSNNDTGSYSFTIAPVLGLGANSDIVSVWFEPSIGYNVSGTKNSAVTHQLAWGAYAELYLTPVKDLEWYFEVDVNNQNPAINDSVYNNNPPANGVNFAASTGITWYLPSLNGAE